MENENKNISTDAKECAELLDDAKKDAQLYGYISVAVKSYIDGLKAAIHCQNYLKPNLSKY